MSGPKRTNYRLQHAIRQRLEEERRVRVQTRNRDQILHLKHRLEQLQLLNQYERSLVLEWINDAETVNERMHLFSAQNRIRGLSKHIDLLSKKESKRHEEKEQLQEKLEELKDYNKKIISLNLNSPFITDRISEWITDSENKIIQGEYIDAKSQINGIENFINKNKDEFLPEMKDRNNKLHLLEDVKRISNYETIITEQISMKIKRLSSLLEESIESNKSLSKMEKAKIESFITQANEMKDKYDQNEEEKNYVMGVITDVIDGQQSSSESDSSKISGQIKGTPVEARFESDNSKSGVIFTINDSHKNCSNVLQKINDEFNNNNIILNDIYVEKTGNIIRLNEPKKIIVQNQSNRNIQK